LFYFILWKQQKRLKVKSKNKDDIISLEAENFIYAESQQNYVILFYLSEYGVKEFRLRSTLKKVQEQILNSCQIHKSYIVNPDYIEKTLGGSKDRFIVLHHIPKPIPVSRSYDISNLLKKR
jgi:DNA-binding LytR/AlgR family response regulator